MSDALTQVIYCPQCSYDLRGLTSETCPECGADFDREALSRSQIPWTYRHETGRRRAFWKTVWQVTFHTDRFAQEAAKPVDYTEARRFQARLVLRPAALLFVIGLVITGYALLTGTWTGTQRLWMLAATILSPPLLAMFLLTATGVHTYWLHPRNLPIEQQNRAVALGYYAGAPLAFTPLVLAMFLIAIGLGYVGIQTVGIVGKALIVIVAVTAAGTLAAIPVACCRIATKLAKRTAMREGSGYWIMSGALPLIWLGLATLWLIIIPAVIAWIGLMIYTL